MTALAFTAATLTFSLGAYYATGAVRRRRREKADAQARCRAAAQRLRATRALEENGMPPRPRLAPPRRWDGPVDPAYDPCGTGPIGRQP